MKLKRNPIIHEIARFGTNCYINGYHRVFINGLENIPKQGPALIIPKHQSMKDIPLEGYILGNRTQRTGNWIMKSSLPKCFEKVGGIMVTRLKDVKEIKDKAKRREYLEKAQQTNTETTDYMKWLYGQGEVIVMHAEGTRNPGAMNPINMPLIKYTKQAQEELEIKIPLVLMGIDYENLTKFRSKVTANIEQLDWDVPNLEQAISTELARLSGL